MTEPTDAELDALRQANHGELNFVTLRQFRVITHTVLAKWGTPPGVAGEPFCYVSVNKQGDITRTMKRKDKWTNIPLYTTPQPTQAQAGAVPLTDEQIAEGFAKRSRHIGLFAGGVRFAEQHHGIKGGQHGAE